MSARVGISGLLRLKKLASLILLTLVVALPACNLLREFDFKRGARMTGGTPELGRKRLAQHSCVSCHFIPGVPRGEGKSAQSLAHWYWRRTFLNTYKNTPQNLEKWLETPSHRKPGTAMPDLSVSPQDSRDMAAYLFSIN